MKFCGYIVAGGENKSLKAIFEHIDSSKWEAFTLYDRNGVPIYIPRIPPMGGTQSGNEPCSESPPGTPARFSLR